MKTRILLLVNYIFFSFVLLSALDYTLPHNTYSIQSDDFDNDNDSVYSDVADPNIKLVRPRTLMQEDDCCDFRNSWEEDK